MDPSPPLLTLNESKPNSQNLLTLENEIYSEKMLNDWIYSICKLYHCQVKNKSLWSINLSLLYLLDEKTMFKCHVNLFSHIITILSLQSGTIWKKMNWTYRILNSSNCKHRNSPQPSDINSRKNVLINKIVTATN